MSILDAVKRTCASNVICDRCLGRQFAMLGSGLSNGERGKNLRVSSMLEAHAAMRDGLLSRGSGDGPEGENVDRAFLESQVEIEHPLALNIQRVINGSVSGERWDQGMIYETEKCMVCNGLFTGAFRSRVVETIVEKQEGLEFDTFLVGSRLPPGFLEREELLRVKYSLRWGESMKTHFNRFIGTVLVNRLGKAVDFKEPDVVFILNIESPTNFNVEVQVNPYFIYGKYRKLVRGIPQTHWPHRECRGAGCEECGYTGKQYPESVEELVTPPIIEMTGGSGAKFHGAGREDIDARMLGDGRPFVVEILGGKKRALDFDLLQKKINEHAGGKVEVHSLRASSKQEMQSLKSGSQLTRKIYRALCTLERELDEATLARIKETLENRPIQQRTPARVLHRRANKTRTKKVYSITWEKVKNTTGVPEIIFIIEASGGTYIKELISSDGGRTVPSITGLAGQQVTCKELDVIGIEEGE